MSPSEVLFTPSSCGKCIPNLPGGQPTKSWPSGGVTVLPVADLRFTFFQGEAPNSRNAAKLLNSYFRFLGRERIATFLYAPVFKLKWSLNVCLGKIRLSEKGFCPIQTQHCRDWQQNPSWDLGLRRLRICYLFHRGILSQERPGRLMFLAECV